MKRLGDRVIVDQMARRTDSPISSSESGQSYSSKPSSFESEFDARALEIEPLVIEDVEAQNKEHATTPLELAVSLKTKMSFLVAWFVLNLVLTISNKSVLGKARYPWLLTTLHNSTTTFGCLILRALGKVSISPLGSRETLVLFAFSFLFTLNIGMSNVSLDLVSVPFHQIMRSACPVITLAIYRLVYNRTYSRATYWSMVPLILGVILATLGDYYCTVVGFMLTLLSIVLASVKTIATNRLMTGPLAPSAIELLCRMSPLAAMQCMIYSILRGEVSQFREELQHGHFPASFGLTLLINGIVAFALNVVSFEANRVAGALGMAVAGNVKQMLTILLGMFLFGVHTGITGALGMMITIGGALWYSKVELDAKRAGKE